MNEIAITKLPKWAQEHIKSLERERDRAKEDLRHYLDSQSKGLIYTRRGFGKNEQKNFIQSDRVIFKLCNTELALRIREVGDGTNCIEVMAEGPMTQLAVFPHVTNVVHIRAVE